MTRPRFAITLVWLMVLFSSQKALDVLVTGKLGREGKFSGLGLHSATFIELLKKDVTVHYVTDEKIPSIGLPEHLLDDVVFTDFAHIKKYPISIFTLLFRKIALNPDAINCVYMTWESTQLPPEKVERLNMFDAVIVTDPFLIKVCKNSRITKPVFVLPPALYLHRFLEQPLKRTVHSPFVFGCVSAFNVRKNFYFLIKVFHNAFNNTSVVRLVIHSNQTYGHEEAELKNYLTTHAITNIVLDHTNYTQDELVNFYKNIDCYILLSKSEGFSITPREAMSLGIPCVLANNTGHKTICDTGLVVGVTSDKPEKVHSAQMGPYGYWFNTDINEAVAALRDVYHNYKKHLRYADKRREWVKQYLPENLRAKYVTLVKPQKVVLDTVNEICEGTIKTNSFALYKKYQKLLLR